MFAAPSLTVRHLAPVPCPDAAAPRGRDGHDDPSYLLVEIAERIVFDYLTRNPGARAGEIAKGLGAGQGAVSAHLYRGKGRLFSCRGGRWFPIPASDPAVLG